MQLAGQQHFSTLGAPLLGVIIDCLTLDQVVARIEAFIAEKQPHLVVTADSTGLIIARHDQEFRRIVQSADLVTPDSVGVVWALRRRGFPVQRVSGVDLVDRLCAASADKGHRIFLLGAAPGVAEEAGERLKLKYPGCNIIGARHGYFPTESDEVVAAEIAEAKPDILLVAMGMPRQEKFIRATRGIINAPVAMGVGGSLDVFSGRTKRAPGWVQRAKLEWLWRLILDPRKMSKVKHLPTFAWLVLRGKA